MKYLAKLYIDDEWTNNDKDKGRLLNFKYRPMFFCCLLT